MTSKLERKLKQEHKGNNSLLFHYTNAEAAYKIIDSNTLKLSNLLTVNDPLEFCDPLHFTFTGQDYNENKIMHELQISLTERKNFVRLLSFCRDYFISPEDWNDEHSPDYANNYLLKKFIQYIKILIKKR